MFLRNKYPQLAYNFACPSTQEISSSVSVEGEGGYILEY
jgi:hypothetical protein